MPGVGTVQELPVDCRTKHGPLGKSIPGCCEYIRKYVQAIGYGLAQDLGAYTVLQLRKKGAPRCARIGFFGHTALSFS